MSRAGLHHVLLAAALCSVLSAQSAQLITDINATPAPRTESLRGHLGR